MYRKLLLLVIVINFGLFSALCSDGWKGYTRNEATAIFTNLNEGIIINKTNATGFASACWSVPVNVKAGLTYTIKVDYHTEDAKTGTLFLLRATSDPESEYVYHDYIQSFWAWNGQSYIRNCPEDWWDTRYSTYTAKSNGEIYIHVILYGNPCSVTCRNLQVDEGEPYRKPNEGEKYKYLVSEEQISDILSKRDEVKAQIGDYNGRTSIIINGKPVSPLIYKGSVPSNQELPRDFTNFGKMGMDLMIYSFSTGVTETDKTGFWLGKDKYDFKKFDESIIKLLRQNPMANLIVDLRIKPYKSWGVENPDDIVRNNNGQKAYGPVGYVSLFATDDSIVNKPGSNKFWYPSWESETWISDLEKMYIAVAKHLKNSPYGKVVTGFFITGGDDGQFVVHYNDFSKVTHQSFHKYLKEKYKTIGKLNSLWKTKYLSFDQINVPSNPRSSEGVHLPVGPVSEFRYFKWQDTWLIRDRLAKVLKESIGKPVITLSYTCPIRSFFLDTRYLDIGGAQPEYANRRPGFALNFMPYTIDYRKDKMIIQEIDYRSVTGGGSNQIIQLEGVGAARTVDEWIQMHRKGIGVSLANGYGNWYYDMGEFFNNPGVHGEIAKVLNYNSRLLQIPVKPFKPDVCIVITETEQFHYTDNILQDYDNHNFNTQWNEYETSGVPYERHYLKDILSKPEFQDFKVYVFSQNSFISNEERSQINSLLKNKNRALVWVYNSGLISESGVSPDNLSEISGIKIADYPGITMRTPLNIDGAPYTTNAKKFFSGVNLRLAINNRPGFQNFYVFDSDATPISKHFETGNVCSAVKKFNGWTSIYIGAGQGLSSEMLNNIASEAGAYIAAPAGEQLNLNGNFASVHGLIDNPNYTLILPQGTSTIIDVDTGTVLAKGIAQYTFSVEAHRTYWFQFE